MVLFGLNASSSVKGVPKGGRPGSGPAHKSEPSASGTSISSLVLSHNTGSHGASGPMGQNDGYAASHDHIFGPPLPVPEQSEPDTASESHTAAPTHHKSSPKLAPIASIAPPPLSQTNADTPFSSGGSIASTSSGTTTRPRAGSTRPAVGVRVPRDRSSARAVLPSSSGSSRGYSTSQARPLSMSSVLASYTQSPSLVPGNAAGSPNLTTDSMVTTSANSILAFYAQSQSPPQSNPLIPDPPLRCHLMITLSHILREVLMLCFPISTPSYRFYFISLICVVLDPLHGGGQPTHALPAHCICI